MVAGDGWCPAQHQRIAHAVMCRADLAVDVRPEVGKTREILRPALRQHGIGRRTVLARGLSAADTAVVEKRREHDAIGVPRQNIAQGRIPRTILGKMHVENDHCSARGEDLFDDERVDFARPREILGHQAQRRRCGDFLGFELAQVQRSLVDRQEHKTVGAGRSGSVPDDGILQGQLGEFQRTNGNRPGQEHPQDAPERADAQKHEKPAARLR